MSLSGVSISEILALAPGVRSGKGVMNHWRTPTTISRIAYTMGMRRQPPGRKPSTALPAVAVMMPGPMILVTDAPTLPAPKTPRAKPLCCGEYQAEFHATPAENELPTMPTQKARTSSIA